MANIKKGVPADQLRRRPDQIRYHYLAVGKLDIHTGCSFGGLQYCNRQDGPLEAIYLTDLKNKVAYEIPESLNEFLDRWRKHYDNPSWDYFAEVQVEGKVLRR